MSREPSPSLRPAICEVSCRAVPRRRVVGAVAVSSLVGAGAMATLLVAGAALRGSAPVPPPASAAACSGPILFTGLDLDSEPACTPAPAPEPAPVPDPAAATPDVAAITVAVDGMGVRATGLPAISGDGTAIAHLASEDGAVFLDLRNVDGDLVIERLPILEAGEGRGDPRAEIPGAAISDRIARRLEDVHARVAGYRPLAGTGLGLRADEVRGHPSTIQHGGLAFHYRAPVLSVRAAEQPGALVADRVAPEWTEPAERACAAEPYLAAVHADLEARAALVRIEFAAGRCAPAPVHHALRLPDDEAVPAEEHPATAPTPRIDLDCLLPSDPERTLTCPCQQTAGFPALSPDGSLVAAVVAFDPGNADHVNRLDVVLLRVEDGAIAETVSILGLEENDRYFQEQGARRIRAAVKQRTEDLARRLEGYTALAGFGTHWMSDEPVASNDQRLTLAAGQVVWLDRGRQRWRFHFPAAAEFGTLTDDEESVPECHPESASAVAMWPLPGDRVLFSVKFGGGGCYCTFEERFYVRDLPPPR
jgi:hypothetical protein